MSKEENNCTTVFLDKYIYQFSKNVILQNISIATANSKDGNKYAKKYIEAFHKIVNEYGDNGREELSKLFYHDDDGVRAMAASFLLKYKTQEAKKILMELAKGNGFIAFGASESLKRWEDGTWQLD